MPTRKTMIAGNWKLNKTIREAIELVTLLKRQINDFQNVDVVICPPYTALSDIAEILSEFTDSPLFGLAQSLVYHPCCKSSQAHPIDS